MGTPQPVLNKHANDYTGMNFDELTDVLFYIEAGIDYLQETVKEGQPISTKQQRWIDSIHKAMSCIAYI